MRTRILRARSGHRASAMSQRLTPAHPIPNHARPLPVQMTSSLLVGAVALFVLTACSILPSASTGPTVTPGPSPTPTQTVLYRNALTSAADGWSNDSNCTFASDGYHIKGGFLCIAP